MRCPKCREVGIKRTYYNISKPYYVNKCLYCGWETVEKDEDD